MILGSERVGQAIDRGQFGWFVKERLVTSGDEPLALTRKRLPPESLDGDRYRGAVLLVHGYGQNRYAWHLPKRSFVNYLAARGFDVFNLELSGHGRSRKLGADVALSIDTHVCHDVPAALDEVAAISGRERVFVVAHSMGALVACAAAGRDPRRFAGLVAIAVPYRFGRGSPALTWAARAAELASRAGLDRVHAARIPVRAIGAWMHRARRAWDNSWVPLPVRAWHPGAYEPELLWDYLNTSFDVASLGTTLQLARISVHDAFRSADGSEDYGAAFERQNVPLLVIAGARDRLAPPESVRPLFDRSHAVDRTWHLLPFGHSDLLLGKRAPERSWPVMETWLRDRAEQFSG